MWIRTAACLFVVRSFPTLRLELEGRPYYLLYRNSRLERRELARVSVCVRERGKQAFYTKERNVKRTVVVRLIFTALVRESYF